MKDGSRGLRIACVHLNDDFSGAGKVFAHAISELKAAGATVRVTVGSGGETGFLRSAHSAGTVFYRFSENRLLLLAYFVLAQLLLFLSAARSCLWWKADVVYANTVLAPGAILAGWLCRRTVVVHLHEVGLGSPALFKLLLALAKGCASRLICVSEYMRGVLDLPGGRTAVVHNSLPPAEWRVARAAAAAGTSRPAAFVVVMACSLKWYKGLDAFLELASHFAAHDADATRPIRFRLLLNCSSTEYTAFAKAQSLPGNLTIVVRPPDVYEHYRDASLVVNLSHREGWIETFGMTLLEAMACGVPVVGPVVGGCTELFADGAGGWRIDSRDPAALVALVRELAGDEPRWAAASRAAEASAARFAPEEFSAGLLAAFRSVVTGRRS